MSRTRQFILSLGSNHDGADNMSHARRLLAGLFPDISFTSDLENEAVDGGRGVYLNCLAKGFTALNADGLNAELKQIEKACGDSREARLRGVVSMDVDLLQLGDMVYHERDWQRPYVRQLLPRL